MLHVFSHAHVGVSLSLWHFHELWVSSVVIHSFHVLHLLYTFLFLCQQVHVGLCGWKHIRYNQKYIWWLYDFTLSLSMTQILFIIKAFVINVSVTSSQTPVKLKALKSLFKGIMVRLSFCHLILFNFPCFSLKYWFSLDSGILYFLNSAFTISQDRPWEFRCACHTGMKSCFLTFVPVMQSDFDYVGRRDKSNMGQRSVTDQISIQFHFS